MSKAFSRHWPCSGKPVFEDPLLVILFSEMARLHLQVFDDEAVVTTEEVWNWPVVTEMFSVGDRSTSFLTRDQYRLELKKKTLGQHTLHHLHQRK